MYRYLFCYRSVNPFSSKIRFCCYVSLDYVTSGYLQEGYLEQSENSLQTLCLPLDHPDLTHADGQIVSNIGVARGGMQHI